MVGDYLMKLLQGALFQKFQNIIMNHTPEQPDATTTMQQDHRSVGQQQSWMSCQSHSTADVQEVTDNRQGHANMISVSHVDRPVSLT